MENIIEELEKIIQEDFEKFPNIVTLLALDKELKRLKLYTLSKHLSKINIQVNQNFIDNKDLFNRTIKAYAQVLLKTEGVFRKHFITDDPVLEHMQDSMRRMSLKYSY